MDRANRQAVTAGLVLIFLGAGFFLLQRAEGIGDEVVLLIIGAAFLGAYFYQKAYGLLIPACILLGLGFGRMLDDWEAVPWWIDEGTVFGLGLGFVSIYVIAWLYERCSHWWPLIPGGILIVVGLDRTGRIFRTLFENWPVILIVIGAVILVRAFLRPKRQATAAPRPASPPAGEPPAAGSEPPVEPKVE